MRNASSTSSTPLENSKTQTQKQKKTQAPRSKRNAKSTDAARNTLVAMMDATRKRRIAPAAIHGPQVSPLVKTGAWKPYGTCEPAVRRLEPVVVLARLSCGLGIVNGGSDIFGEGCGW